MGERAEVAVFEMGQIDPRKIVKDGIKHAKDYGNDLVIIDTAGRLHIDEELMNLLHLRTAIHSEIQLRMFSGVL